MAEDIDDNVTDPTDEAGEPNWSQIWHLPALLLGVGVFVFGIYLALPEPEKDQFAEVLDEVGLYLKAYNLGRSRAGP